MNINTQKKNCNRCIADKHSNYECDLGYKREVKSYDEYGFTKFGIPLEPCPKPKTNSDYIFAKNGIQKGKYELSIHLSSGPRQQNIQKSHSLR